MSGDAKWARAAAYGTALAALCAADSAEGAVVTLTPVPGPYLAYPSPPAAILLTGSGYSFLFLWRNLFLGKSFYAIPPIAGLGAFNGAPSITAAGATLTTVGNSPGATGTGTIGFRTLSNRLGYFQVQWGGAGGPMIIGAAGVEKLANTPILLAAGSPVPEPGSAALFGLGTLALGAAGLRRRRKRRAEAAAA